MPTLAFSIPGQDGWQVREMSFSQDGSRVVIYAVSYPSGDAAWVVNVSTGKIESRHSTDGSEGNYLGAKRSA